MLDLARQKNRHTASKCRFFVGLKFYLEKFSSGLLRLLFFAMK